MSYEIDPRHLLNKSNKSYKYLIIITNWNKKFNYVELKELKYKTIKRYNYSKNYKIILETEYWNKNFTIKIKMHNNKALWKNYYIGS